VCSNQQLPVKSDGVSHKALNKLTAGGLRMLLHEVQYNFIHKDAIFIKELTAKFMASRGFVLICKPEVAYAPKLQRRSAYGPSAQKLSA
jgi:hypothetical protein